MIEAQAHRESHDRRFNLKGRRGWVASSLLIAAIVGVGAILALWKQSSIEAAEAQSANQPEPMEMVTAAVASARDHRETTTSIGTVLALRSVELRNELPGTVRQVSLRPGQIVEAGTVLVALDVSVEQAELKALEAQAALTETVLARVQRLYNERAEAQTALDRARAERAVALAEEGDHRAQDHPRAVPRSRRDRRRSSGAVSDRRHHPHHAPERR